jgi:hypothetical protein
MSPAFVVMVALMVLGIGAVEWQLHATRAKLG